jgi:hypothetical protein
MFCGKDIERLKMLKTGVKIGHSISQIAGLSSEDLMELVKLDVPAASEVSTARESASLNAAYFYDRSLSTVLNFDAKGLGTPEQIGVDQGRHRTTMPKNRRVMGTRRAKSHQ